MEKIKVLGRDVEREINVILNKIYELPHGKAALAQTGAPNSFDSDQELLSFLDVATTGDTDEDISRGSDGLIDESDLKFINQQLSENNKLKVSDFFSIQPEIKELLDRYKKRRPRFIDNPAPLHHDPGHVVAPGPLDPKCAEAIESMETMMTYVRSNAPKSIKEHLKEHLLPPGFSSPPDLYEDPDHHPFMPISVNVDVLGHSHIYMQRYHEGVRVIDADIVGHIRRNKMRFLSGSIFELPETLDQLSFNIDREQAYELASKAFVADRENNKEGLPPYKNAAGVRFPAEPVFVPLNKVDNKNNPLYAPAYLVELYNPETEPAPMRMVYWVDATTQTGTILKSVNRIVTPIPPQTSDLPEKIAAEIQPNIKLQDKGKTTSTLVIDKNISLQELKLNLNIEHSFRGDLKVTLSNPQLTKSWLIHDRAGGANDNIILRDFLDEGQHFKGEMSAGFWTLTIEDVAEGDQGKLKSWGLTLTGKNAQPDPLPPNPNPSNANTLYSGRVFLDMTPTDDGFEFRSKKGDKTGDAENQPTAIGAPTIRENKDGKVGEPTDDIENPAQRRGGIDAHYGADVVRRTLLWLGRNSLDGNGEKILSFVRVGLNKTWAFWNGSATNFGEGDGIKAGPLPTIDIFGHEAWHGVIERTANLPYEGESGALNESLADIFGTLAEYIAYKQDGKKPQNWTIGEDCWTPQNGDKTDGIRSLEDPSKDNYSIDHYSKYKTSDKEVHRTSGISNNAFYLLSQGGTNRTSKKQVVGGIGIESAALIFFRAQVYYLAGTKKRFKDAREATLRAAKDLFGDKSKEVQKVKDAWTAVGVG